MVWFYWAEMPGRGGFCLKNEGDASGAQKCGCYTVEIQAK